MPDWKGIVGISFTPDEFNSYCHSLQWNAWRPSFIVLHNTAIPSLAQRPDGITQQHIQNFVSFYRDVQGWSSGPHLFIDDRQIWVFTPLTTPGTHSPSWNNVSLGVEMLGNYDLEAFDGGRGLLVRKNAVAALATLSAMLGIDSQTMRLHREDPLTTHACPGKNVPKMAVIQEVQALVVARHPGEHVISTDGPAPNPSSMSVPTSTAGQSSTPAPSGALAPSGTSIPSDTSVPSGTSMPSGTPASSGTTAPTAIPVPAGISASSGEAAAAGSPAPPGTPAPSATPAPSSPDARDGLE